MEKKQATRANRNQIEQHIKRQRQGIPGMEFAHRHPILDAVLGALLLAAFITITIGALIKCGAGI